MTGVDTDPIAIERLRQALPAYVDNQLLALTGIDRLAQETSDALENARREWEREVARRAAAYESCLSAAARAEEGQYIDCGGLRWALDEAESRLGSVLRAIADVRQGIQTYQPVAERHRGFLSSTVPAMRTGLEARVTSLESYLAWSVSLGSQGPSPDARQAGRVLVDEHTRGLKGDPRGQGYPVEQRESGAGGPERRG
jgi:hypothetical protein